MDRICGGSPFWDEQLSWNTTDPYLTHCFEETVISWFPIAFLLPFAAVDLLRNHRRARVKDDSNAGGWRWTWSLIGAKSALSALLVLNYAVQIVRLLVVPDIPWNVFLSPAAQLIAHIAIFSLCLASWRSRVQPTGVQFVFWLLTTLGQAILFRTAWHHYDGNAMDDQLQVIYLSRIIALPLVCTRFLLECFRYEHGADVARVGPHKTGSFFSNIFVLWYDSLAWRGYTRVLLPDDIWELDYQDTSRHQHKQFEKYWRRATGEHEGILIPLAHCFGLAFLFTILLKLGADLLVFVQTEMIRCLVTSITIGTEPVCHLYFYTATLAAAAVLQAILNAASAQRALLIGMRITSALSNAVFHKALRITSAQTTVDQLTTLVAVDAKKFGYLMRMVNLVVASPFQVPVCIWLLYNALGPSVFVGLVTLLLLMGADSALCVVARRLQARQMRLKDERLRLTTELITNIKGIKLGGMETSYEQRIEVIRAEEITCVWRIALLDLAGFISAPFLMALVTYAVYVSVDPLKHVLDAERTFVTLALFNVLRTPAALIPFVVSLLSQATVSVDRLSKFLQTLELDENAVTHNEKYDDLIVVQRGTFAWTDDSMAVATLRGIELKVKEGELVAIVGATGSGKSSLLAALLGELKKLDGVVNTRGSIAYIGQSAWIQAASVRENVLCGDALDSVRYNRVMEACALKPDLESFVAGDETEIGEGGSNLSGGQKQRLVLARAMYKDAAVYLLDDPFSALDVHVARHVFEEVVMGLLEGKTRVIVTNDLRLLPLADRIVMLQNGEISEVGKYQELLNKKGTFAELLQQQKDHPVQETAQIGEQDRRDSLAKLATSTKLVEVEKTVQEQELPELATGLGIVWRYFRCGGALATFASILLIASSCGLTGYSSVWLSVWSDEPNQAETYRKYLLGYGAIFVVQALLNILGSGWLGWVSSRASRALHTRCLAAILRAPLSYFDGAPHGRLLNRLGKDLDTVDSVLPQTVRWFANFALQLMATLAVVAGTMPLFIALAVPMVILYLILQRFYVATSRQLRRLESVTRSPIYAHLAEAVTGTSVIRTFGLQPRFVAECERRVDRNQKLDFALNASTVWISLRLELLGILIIVATCCLALLNGGRSLSPNQAGLAIVYSLQITALFNLVARQESELETEAVAVERIIELETEVPRESTCEQKGHSPASLPHDWPRTGEIRFLDYDLKYGEGKEPVLRSITCVIKGGEKVGVVGRTGAGKSSLALALFRIVEASGGSIQIDGVDISKVDVHLLRSRMTIVAQDAVFFSGSVRYNVDPFGRCSDTLIWNCLKKTQLKTHVAALAGGLDAIVEEGGRNLSAGQRQLLCLARALLRKTRILVLDEATATVDPEADQVIQQTIRTEFRDCTVVTIAHKLATVLDSDRILVMGKGRVLEFDTPDKLLADRKSVFWQMAHETNF